MSKINNIKNGIIYIMLCVAITLFMTGCGFELRSQKSFPPQLNNIYYQPDKPYSEVALDLKKALKSANIIFATDVNSANIIFHLSDTTFSHSDTSVGPSTQARVYSLTMSITFNITDNKGKTILEPQTITIYRSLTLQANEIFEVSTQVDVLKHSMERELIMRTFNILGSKKSFDAFGFGGSKNI